MFTQPLVIGSTYRVKFKSIFERHGVCTTPGATCLHKGGGVFRLEQITNFRDVVYSGIKLYVVFFKPLGISELEYRTYFDDKPADRYEPKYATKTMSVTLNDHEASNDKETGTLTVKHVKRVTKHEVHVETGESILKRHYKDRVDYASYPLYKFVDVIDSNDIIWAPELTIDGFPEIDIREYRDLSLVVHLGYTHDPATLDPMLLSIRERMAAYGWRPSLVRLYSTDSKWMSPKEYDAIKNLRIPATVEVIGTKEDYTAKKATMTKKEAVGEIALIDGALKKIVDAINGEVGDPSSEIDVNSIMRHNQVLDRSLFLTKSDVTDVFATGENYFRIYKDENGFTYLKHLREGYDYSPGGACVTYTPTELQENDHRELYVRTEGTWYHIAYGTNRDYDPATLFTRSQVIDYLPVDLEVTPTPEDGVEYFVRVVDEVDGESYLSFHVDSFDPNQEYFTAASELVTQYTLATELDIADPSVVLWRKNPDGYIKRTTETTGLYEQIVACKEVYGTVDATKLMGFKFEFDDEFGQPKTITLQLEDIIEAAFREENVILPAEDDEDAWKKYLGRRFKEVISNRRDPTKSETIETVITKDKKHILAGKAGTILGQSGTIYKEMYIKDSGQQKRNYYMKYVTLTKSMEEQKSRINELEAAMIQVQNTNEKLVTEKEQLEQEKQELLAEIERLRAETT